MTDIVERLSARKGFWLNGGAWMMSTEPDDDCAEAAEEIKRLRKGGCRLFEDEAEIERLELEIAAWRQSSDLKAAEIKRLRAENEDLRRWKAMDKPLTAAMAVVNNDVVALRAEVERLRTDRSKLIALLADVRGPQGETEERVAEWLRGRGTLEPKS